MHSGSDRLKHFSESIFGTMGKKALEHNAINLSQGFPDFDGPEFVKAKMIEAIQLGFGQYAASTGLLQLRESIRDYYQSFYELAYCRDEEITVCTGATEGIFTTILALVNPGDEVILFEPFYDSYYASILMAGGIPVPVTMHAPSFEIDTDELRKAITKKTKLIIFNNPHNPSGRVFNKQELDGLVSVLSDTDTYILSDEVYEFLTYDGLKHIPLATYEQISNRVITISSAGKTFGLTGWKVGWMCAPKDISIHLRKTRQYITFSVNTPAQYAIADGLKRLDTYIPEFKASYQTKRDFLYAGLKALGFNFPCPQGSYFMMVPFSGNDFKNAMFLVEHKKLATIPASPFYLKSEDGTHYLRLCFAKKEETLKQALQCLQGL
jgi:N-succinyldiaminopimelate aminotransferase